MKDGDERIEALETHVAHQAETIEQLDSVVRAQWEAIERLGRELRVLRERLDEPDEDVPIDKPPHY